MLHHCNVDRLVAMWQVIHYEETMFNFTANSTGQYATVANSPITADSPLKPFFDENMNFHTSNSVANISTFGYTYPEMPNWAMPPEARASHVRAHVNSLYSGGTNGLGQTRALTKADRPRIRNYYTAEISVDRSDMPLPVILRLVVGRTVVGRMSLLGMPHVGIAAVSVPLQDVAIGNQSMRNLPAAMVVLFLQQNLRTEIVKVRTSPKVLFAALEAEKEAKQD
jgi:tyrosinase